MNPSKWSHAIIKFLCKGNAFWTRFSVRSGSLGTRRVAPARAVLEVFPQNFESGKTACLLSSSGRSLEKSLSGRLSGVTLQYLRRELPPSRRLCCGGDVSLRFSASPTISPPPPHPSAQRPALGGLPGPGWFRCRVRGRSRPAFPPPSIHQWETGDAGAPGLGRVVAAAGDRGRRRPAVCLPLPGPGLARPFPPGALAHPWPSACELGPWAVYGRGRAEPRLRGARVWAAAW